MLITRFGEIDYQQAKADVEPFIKSTRSLALWSKEFFASITEQLIDI